VVFEGFQTDPVRFMARASVFVLPSRFEGMPNALLEAMAAGLPVVVSDASPGPLEMVDPGVHGLVVPSENVEALAEALGRLMVDSELRERLGRAARQRLRSLDWDVVEPHWRSVLALPPLR
jgi:glycosyltransferase involved in cell wall biosynthesis